MKDDRLHDTDESGELTREAKIRRRVHKLAEFYQHAMIYALIITGFWVLNAFTLYQSSKDFSWRQVWAIWPMLGWGIGLFAHWLTVAPFGGFFSQEWEDRKVRELLEREGK